VSLPPSISVEHDFFRAAEHAVVVLEQAPDGLLLSGDYGQPRALLHRRWLALHVRACCSGYTRSSSVSQMREVLQEAAARGELLAPEESVLALPRPMPAAASRRELNRGLVVDDVHQWQLIVGGLVTDAEFGGLTEAATRAWQAAHGLGASGFLGASTWERAVEAA